MSVTDRERPPRWLSFAVGRGEVRTKAQGSNLDVSNACHLTRFSGFFSPADSGTPKRQEAQIVQSQLDLRDFLAVIRVPLAGLRSLPAFSRFLDVAALSDTEPVNFSNIARECGVSSPTVKGYFGILEDTLLGRWLPAWRKRLKRRLIGAPKFYFADVGVVNRLARRGTVHRGSELYGKAFENWVHHELAAFVAYTDLDAELTHWRLPSGIEVDFVLGDMALAVEAKASANIGRPYLKGLRSLALEHDPGRRVVVCLEPRPRRTPDGIEVLPAETFVRRLWEGGLVAGG